jgi:hypothetical protein
MLLKCISRTSLGGLLFLLYPFRCEHQWQRRVRVRATGPRPIPIDCSFLGICDRKEDFARSPGKSAGNDNHNLAFGTNIRFIEDLGSSNLLSYSNASGTYQYLSPATVAGSGGAFDPGVYGFPTVASQYRSDYNNSAMAIAGILNLAGVPVSSVQPVAYWEQLFGALGGQDIGYGTEHTATQNIYELYQTDLYNEANSLYALDMPDTTTGDGINPNQAYPSNRFYHDQFSALYAWRSIGASNYNALQVVYRQRFGLGLQADFNYTYSKSLDTTSQAERLGSSGSTNNAQIFNTWAPNQLYGPSDFDLRHQLNANYIWDLPFGRGKHYASSIGRVADLLIGGWQTTGIVRWTSGFPFEVNNGANFPTDYDIQGFATQISKITAGRGKLQQQFVNPAATLAAFDFTLPSDSGTRNPLRGDGYFEEDAGLGKTFTLSDRFKLKAGIEVFNVTNSVRFDAHSVSAAIDNPSSFGNATAMLTNPRLAQFYGRFEF